VTREEAIKCLTVEIGLRSSGYYDHLAHGGKQDKAEEEFLDSLQMAIAALREQEERSKGCAYCTPCQGNYGYSFAKDIPDTDGSIAVCIRWANTGVVTLHAEAYSHDDSGGEICEYDSDSTVRFCPMCGRRLEEHHG
jgi:hypothetical protein